MPYGPNDNIANALSPAVLNSLKGVVREAASQWLRIGRRAYQNGANPFPSFEKGRGGVYEDAIITGAYTIPEINRRGDPAPILTGGAIGAVRYRRRIWKGAVQYLEDDAWDDGIGIYEKMVRWLVDSLEYALELLYHEPFFRYADATYLGGWDEKPLASTAHVRLNGETYSNQVAFATPTDLVIRDIENYFATLKDDNGRFAPITGRLTIFTSTKHFLTLKQVLNATTAITNPLNATQINPNPNIPPIFSTERFEVIASPYLNAVNNGNVMFVLAQGHDMFVATARSNQRMVPLREPLGAKHVVEWSGNVGWRRANHILVYG